MQPDDPRHGTTNGYGNLRCRCDACRHAWNAYCVEYQHRTGRSKPLAEHLAEVAARHVHGTEGGYQRGCKCKPCREAASAARRHRRHAGQVLTHNAAGYANGCRCDVCREANTAKSRRYRATA